MISNSDVIKVLKKKGSVVALKTDTVYGLVCNAYDIDAVNKIYKIKSREKNKPLSLFVKDINEVKKYVSDDCITKHSIDIMKKYWPGPLTIIFKKKENILNYMVSNQNTIGIRIPNDNYILNLLNELSFPLAETSCNVSGEEAYKSFDEIYKNFSNKIDLIIDGGEVTNNVPSTVITLMNDEIIINRKGTIDLKGGTYV